MLKKYIKQISLLSSKMFSSLTTVSHTDRPVLRFAAKKEQSLPTDSVIPLCMFTESSLRFHKPKDFINIIKKDIPYSRYKLNVVLAMIRKKDIHDAIKLLETMDKKGSAIVKYELEKKLKIFSERNDDFIYQQYKIVEAFVGGRFGPGKIDIRARSKFGIRHKPYSSFTIRLKKITPNKVMADAIMGKSSFTFSNFIKSVLFQNKLGFQSMKEWSFMTASKSKHYRRTQIKRIITSIRLFLKQRGIVVSHEFAKERLTQYILNRKYIDFNEMLEQKQKLNIMTRLQHFSKKYKKI